MLAAIDGEKSSRTQTEPDEYRCQKCHERVGGTDCGECILAQNSADDDSICDIIKLLQEISRHHWKREQQQGFCDIALCQIVKHNKDIIAGSGRKDNLQKVSLILRFSDEFADNPCSYRCKGLYL